MPLTDADLIDLFRKAADALDKEAAWIVDVDVDVDVDDRGRSKPSIPRADQPYYEAVTEIAQAVRDLIVMIQARSRST